MSDQATPVHHCSYDGRNYDMKAKGKDRLPLDCGQEGWICVRCQMDRLDEMLQCAVSQLLGGLTDVDFPVRVSGRPGEW